MDDAAAFAALNIFRGDTTNIQVQRVGRAGFSGSSLWKVTALGQAPLCLKAWPASHQPPERLPWIHQVLFHSRKLGVSFIPEPQVTQQGKTTCEVAGSTWELMTWLPGSADYDQRPSQERLTNAFRALALFHHTTAVFTSGYGYSASFAKNTPAITQRIKRWQELVGGRIATISAAVQERRVTEIDDLAQQWTARHAQLPAVLLRQLLAAHQERPQLQPAIRDLWHDHVLFTDDAVTGFIDFGALRWDTKFADVARLLGSLAGDDEALRTTALNAYAGSQRLNSQHRSLIELLDHTGTLISGWNWLDWLYVEQRSFLSLTAVRARMTHLLSRSLSPKAT